MLETRGFNRTRKRFNYQGRFDQSSPQEIKRIYDNSDMIKFMSTRYGDKRMKKFSVSHKKNVSLLPQVQFKKMQISIPSTRDQESAKKARNNSVSLKQQINPRESFTYDFRSTLYHPKPAHPSFVFKSSDTMIMKALIRDGWKEVKPRNSTHFTLKWVQFEDKMDYVYLRDNQRFNHIKNIEEVISIEHLAKVLEKSEFYPKTINLERDYDEFCKQFDQCAILNLLKKHIEYFKLKAADLVDCPLTVSVVDILKNSKFTQPKSQQFLVNVALLVQACLYFEQVLENLGLPASHGLDINLDNRSIQNMVTYSRLNPPYDQYQSFKHSYMQNEGEERNSSTRTSSKDSRNRMSFSRNFQRYNSSEPLATPSAELISLLVTYHKTFSNQLAWYKGVGNENQWLILNNSHRNWNQQIVSNKKITITSSTFAQKLIEKPLTLNSNRPVITKTYALLLIHEGTDKLYMLNKHFCFEANNIWQCPAIKTKNEFQLVQLEKFSQSLNLEKFMPVFSSQIKSIVNKSITLKTLQKRKYCFSLLTFYCVVDTSFNVWLQDISAESDLFIQGIIDQHLSVDIASELVKIVMHQSHQNIFWQNLSAETITSKRHSLPVATLNNGIVRLIRDRLIASKFVQDLAQQLYLKIVMEDLRKVISWKSGRKKQKIIDIRLGVVLLSRIERSRIKYSFYKIYDF